MQITRLTLLGAASKASYELDASDYMLALSQTPGGNVVLHGVSMEKRKEPFGLKSVVLA
jgi:hypothetical protein